MNRNDPYSHFRLPVAHRAIPCLVIYFAFGVAAFAWHEFSSIPLPGWFQSYALLGVVSILLVWLWRAGWKPRWRLSSRSAWMCIVFLLIYLTTLKTLDFTLARLGVEATPYHQYFQLGLLIQQLILAPVIEELFFRDFLLRSFWQQMGSWRRAAFFSSAFFMLAHFSLYPGAFLLGLVGAVLMIYFRSVTPAIIFHVISNASLYFLPRYFPHLTQALHEWQLFDIFYR